MIDHTERLEVLMDFSSGWASEPRVRVTYGLRAGPEPESAAGTHQSSESSNWAAFEGWCS